MHERLLEGWLDSAGERTYQGPFCQVLSAMGYTVLHSTRHAPIEFGKDVIAVAPDGVPCAYQLKGNPGARLTHAQFRDIHAQLFELATQAIVFPGCPPGPHRSYLVTNGNVDEEVQRAIDDMNRSFDRSGTGSIVIISRGQLLQWFRDHAAEFWPSEIPELNRVFQLLAATGNEQPPFELLHEVLGAMLHLDPKVEESLGAAELERRITSAALVVAVCMRSFSQRDNHYAVIAAWVLYATYVAAACERFAHAPDNVAGRAVAIAQETVLRSLLDLAEEASRRAHHVEGDPLTDTAVYRARRSLMVGLFSALWLWCKRSGAWPVEEAKEKVQALIDAARGEMELWGEGAVPQFLALHWYQAAANASISSDLLLRDVLRATVAIQKDGTESFTLPSPYYSIEDVRRHQLARATGAPDPFEHDSRRAASSFAEPLFHLLVRTGLKRTCKDIWPDLTRIAHESFEPAHAWGFCLWRTATGVSHTRILTHEEQWSNVVESARCIGTPEVPTFLRERPELLLLFAILCPHRATPNVVRYLGRVFNDVWWIAPPVDEAPTGG